MFWRAFNLVVLAALLAGEALAGDVPPTDWTNTYRHFDHRVNPPRQFVPPRLRFSDSRMVYTLPNGLDGLATLDKTLTHLCQRGAFIQKSDGFYWAVSPGRRYGVAFSGGANLDDAQNKRQAGKVYFFHNQDSRCTVYVGDQAKLMPHYVAS
ncbi:hypothetical protein ACIU1J_18115 [Azospirillum doebereinerae]|uniref:hypothetical protein n=1 Tax=Azospirillum doebereinerae TaxID=92933 RepID=UPI001EE629FE|nr:hypothetical protein [Azospirillum doebereinerae]MCG5242534.1 hypothetical protein [Azospirillum doebereinerae]